MKIAVYSGTDADVRRLGVVVDGQIAPLTTEVNTTQAPHWTNDVGLFLERGDSLDEAARRALESDEPLVPISSVRLRAPLRRPGKILAIGLNYEDHRAETPIRAEKPPYAEGFVKLSSSIVGPEDPIVAWPDVKQLDYEVELAVVIGRTAHNVSECDALNFVAGYTVANDVSARDWQLSERSRRRSPVMGKSFPSFCPLGPWLVTTDTIPDPQALALCLRVNGKTRQSSTTAEMIFSVAQAIAHWSKLRLDPGDVILTGTPSGVALGRKPGETPYWLNVGDVIEAEIEKIGVLRNTVTAS